jgi:hypothetical protein
MVGFGKFCIYAPLGEKFSVDNPIRSWYNYSIRKGDELNEAWSIKRFFTRAG